MRLSEFSNTAIPKIEAEMKDILLSAKQVHDTSLYDMLTYHLGWSGEAVSRQSQGKRIRPLFLLLTTGAAGGDWETSVSAAATIELIHNFSLIHDDIEDNSEERRGRKTLWVRDSMPLALNAGDALFSISFLGLARLEKFHPNQTIVTAYSLIAETCLTLTQGQHMDISFENADNVTVDQYLEMISGKTGALLAASTELGAILAGVNPKVRQHYKSAGLNLGLAFQVVDDILGIWGDPQKTGKSASSDLLSRKKSLPILFGLSRSGKFSELWDQEITPSNVHILAGQLKIEGAYDYAKTIARQYTQTALDAIENANPGGIYAEAFDELVRSLTQRDY